MFELLKNYIRGLFSKFPKGKESQGESDFDDDSDSYDTNTDTEWDYPDNITDEAYSNADSASDCCDSDSSSSD